MTTEKFKGLVALGSSITALGFIFLFSVFILVHHSQN